MSGEDDSGRCYELALRYLDFRPRSESELRKHLISKYKFDAEVVDLAVERLKRNKLLNDSAFAESWVNDRIAYKPKSRMMIRRELLQKGICDEIAEGATRLLDDSDSAYMSAVKKARLLHSLDRLEFFRRMTAYLGRRGYDGQVILKIVNKLWNEVSGK